jgi:hypothetical protein
MKKKKKNQGLVNISDLSSMYIYINITYKKKKKNQHKYTRKLTIFTEKKMEEN